ncbi:DUF2264 domain-containing protein [Devosia psychrophila]|uniref:DUF2264 domain-containing protein n=1 Tax=Devosia psychrophila TaxID=728005 RepID=A0A0F5PUC1_9HYPH|nr:DUF2264 domain-containing protein [Devosia psychrophila]KKC31414.1 hypothetical protein WH91_19430 [Devosia psychrophila]SFC94059.1 hypothetical protein SAMN04488059_11533 [Devosia psychrophila]
MTYDPVSANPLHGNPLKSRADVEKALHDLFNPLLPFFSEGGARVRLDGAAAHFDRAAADLEGFARPLWGLTPLAAGGGRFDHWELYRRGLANGTDPEHPEYWGTVNSTDQRMVELAAIGFTMRLLPDKVWQPLSQQAKSNLAAYLKHARSFDYADNNWKFFRILVDLGLEECGVEFDRSLTEKYLEELDAFYLGDGWYRDGNVRRIDHYIPFAMHFYGLIYAALAKGDDKRVAAYKERATLFAKDIRHWFDEDGGTLAFGRSLTYRFACGGIWGALAFADLEALPWGEIKGQYMRHLRWWADKPIANRDGVLSVGYGYPNLFMSESYNSAGSPYWALKAFLPLALPADHPFWTAEESKAVTDDAPIPLKHPGMVMMHTPGNVVALSSGQQNWQMRHGSEKYAKFIYSSRYGFSVEVDERAYNMGAFDGALAFSDDGRHYRVRENNEVAQIAGDTLFARWKPWTDVTVETWLLPASPWHIRVHRITTPRTLHATEGGFAIERADLNADTYIDEPGSGAAKSETDVSAIVDLAGQREGRAHRPYPNTNLIASKTIVPQLRGEISAGTTVLMTAAMALPAGDAAEAALRQPPEAPDITELEALFAREGVDVSAILVPERF